MLKAIKKIIANILLFLAAVVFLFFVFEFAFRFFKGKELYLKITTGNEDSRAEHLFKPGSSHRLKSSKKDEFDVFVRINNYGYRGKDLELQKQKGTLRIFAVGDSFTYGVGAEENQTIPFIIEQNLHNQGLPIEVVNAGIGHASPLSYYLKLRDIHLKFKPDLVILLLDFSDLRDDWRTEKNLVYGKNGKILYVDPYTNEGKKDLWKLARANSVFCAYIHNKIIRTFGKMKTLGLRNYIKAALQGKRAKAVIANLKNEEAGSDTIEYDQYLFIRGRDKLPQINKHWKRTAKYLLMIRELLKENNVGFILVTYPYGVQVSPQQWPEGRIYWGFEEGKTYTDRYAFELIENFAAENNIAHINTLDDFLKNKDSKLFFDLDGHLTPEGNKVAADSITRNEAFKKILIGLTTEGRK